MSTDISKFATSNLSYDIAMTIIITILLILFLTLIAIA